MKHYTSIIFSACLVVILLGAGCTPKGNADASFWVRGNCDMCKERIETALSSTNGVSSADYDVDAQTVTVSFDSTAVTVPDLHRVCAGVGHETKQATAPTDVEVALPKCCQKGQSM